MDADNWLDANTLDPHLQQCAANYLRALGLIRDGHPLEAVVAFDCVVQGALFFLRTRGLLTEDVTRRGLCRHLGLKEPHGHYAEFAYFIRNSFGAHPSGWRWWDVQELLETELHEIHRVTRRILDEISRIEPTHRRVDVNPQDWGAWLLKHFKVVFDAVWFDQIAVWDRHHPHPEPEAEGA